MAKPQPERTPHEQAQAELHLATLKPREHFGKTLGKPGWSDWNSDMEEAALTKTLRDLTDEEYAHLCWHACCWYRDDPDAVKYFLPRLLPDMALDIPLALVGWEMAMLWLVGGQWLEWPKHERDAVHRWLECWLAVVATSPIAIQTNENAYLYFSSERSADDVISALSLAGVDVMPHLLAWQESQSRETALHLMSFMLAVSEAERKGQPGWGVALWGDDESISEQQRAAVTGWLRSESTYGWLVSKASTAPQDDVRVAAELLAMYLPK